jgi:hypothetical protein
MPQSRAAELCRPSPRANSASSCEHPVRRRVECGRAAIAAVTTALHRHWVASTRDNSPSRVLELVLPMKTRDVLTFWRWATTGTRPT